MANKRKYANVDEYKKAMTVKHNAYNDRVYKKLTVSLPKELAAELDDAVKRSGLSKRQFVINIIETALK